MTRIAWWSTSSRIRYTILEVGDVVMVRHPNNPDQTLVKRIVAAPGDTIGFQAGVVVRNGVAEAETFIPAEFRSAR